MGGKARSGICLGENRKTIHDSGGGGLVSKSILGRLDEFTADRIEYFAERNGEIFAHL